MKKIAKITALVLALVMIFALVGCSKETNDNKGGDTSNPGGTDTNNSGNENEGRRTKVTVALTNTVADFSPFFKWNPYVGIMYGGVYERLGERKQYQSDEFIGVLLKDFEQLDDYTWHCTLYDYITDANGNPFTSSDVKFSIEQQVANAVTTASYVEEIEIINDYEFNMKTTISTPGTFYWICETGWMATEASYTACGDGDVCVGTGPYVCTEFIAGSTTTVEKRDDYWQTEELTAPTSQANIDVIEYNIVNETTQMGIAMEDPDTTQICAWIDGSLVADAKANDDIVVTELPSIQWKQIMFNCSENSVFQDENLRKAVCYAIDAQAIIDTVYAGIGEVPTGYGLSAAQGFNEDWYNYMDYYTQNLDTAKEYMAKSDYPDGGITVKWSGSINTINENTGAYLTAALEPLGIKVVTELYETAVSTQVQGDFTAWDLCDRTSSLTGPHIMQTLVSWFDKNNNKYGSAYGGDFYFEELQEYVDAAKLADSTQEDYDNVIYYVMDHAITYQYMIGMFDAAHSPYVEGLLTNFKNNLIVGACTYSEDWPYFAD